MRHDQTPDVLYHELDPHELLRRAGEGDAGAMEQLYYRHRDTILTYGWIMTGDHDTAVEAVKTSFNDLFKELGSLGPDDVRPFLFRRMRRDVLEVEDRPGVSSTGSLELDGDTLAGEGNWTGPSSDLTIGEDVEAAMDTLLKMPAGLRDAVVLRLVFEISGDELLIIQDVPPEKVKVRLKEGLKRLRDRTKEVGGGPTTPPERSCSMARMGTWLDRVFSSPSESTSDRSSMEQHLDRCADCRAVREELQEIRDRVGSLRSISLPPFPKGDESDLLATAREEADRLATASDDRKSWDPDLKQVLWLLPGGLLLVVAVGLLPLFFQEQETAGNDRSEPTVPAGEPIRFERVMTLDTGGRSVSRVRVAIRLSDRMNVTSIVPAAGEKQVQILRGSGSEEAVDDGKMSEFTLVFSPPYTGDAREVVQLTLEGPSSGGPEKPLPVVRSAFGPDGEERSVQVRFGSTGR